MRCDVMIVRRKATDPGDGFADCGLRAEGREGMKTSVGYSTRLTRQSVSLSVCFNGNADHGCVHDSTRLDSVRNTEKARVSSFKFQTPARARWAAESLFLKIIVVVMSRRSSNSTGQADDDDPTVPYTQASVSCLVCLSVCSLRTRESGDRQTVRQPSLPTYENTESGPRDVLQYFLRMLPLFTVRATCLRALQNV